MVSANGGALVNDASGTNMDQAQRIHCVYGFGGSGQDFSLPASEAASEVCGSAWPWR